MISVRHFRPDPFIVVLVATVTLAGFLPARGLSAAIFDGAATCAITVLFFLHGVRLSRDAIVTGVAHWRLHATILAATFLLFPALGLLAMLSVPGLLPPPLWAGILFLCALPSTVQSAIAFTSMARGNVPAAIASATASNLFGMALTPMIVGLLLHVHGGLVSPGSLGKIIVQMLLPFVVGHLCRPLLGGWAARNKSLMMLTDRGTIVLAVYSAFSAAVIGGIWQQLPAERLLALMGLCAAILAIVLLVTRYGSRMLGFDREDEIAILFCGSKKTLASSIPMARILFAGPDMGAAVLPLMIFHQMQLIVCACLARRYATQATESRGTSRQVSERDRSRSASAPIIATPGASGDIS